MPRASSDTPETRAHLVAVSEALARGECPALLPDATLREIAWSWVWAKPGTDLERQLHARLVAKAAEEAGP